MQLRTFQQDDLDAVKQVIDETVETCYSHYPIEYRQHTMEDHNSKTQILNKAATGFTIVLQVNEHIIGTGTLLNNKIEGVYIHPEHQRQSYGTLIMQALEEHAHETGSHKVTLSSHTVSKAFYDALGYSVLEERTFTAGTDTQFRYYIMEKSI